MMYIFKKIRNITLREENLDLSCHVTKVTKLIYFTKQECSYQAIDV